MADRWCILRTSGGRTLPLARSLAASGYRVWTPSEVINRRRPRSTATIDIEAPIMPTFVFVRSDRLLDLVTTLALPISPHPPFSIFHHGERIPLISDREIAGLQAEEARLAKVRERKLAGFKRRERHDVEAGTEIKLPDDAFVGLTGVVEYGDGKHAVVSFGGSLRLKIETWRLACDRVEAASSLEDTAARAA